MKHPEILLMFHCEKNTGYAIGRLEAVFYEAAIVAGFKPDDIYWSFNGGVNPGGEKIISCGYKNKVDCDALDLFLSKRNIVVALAFDLGYPADVLSVLKRHGVSIVSYWGGSMSSINSGVKLTIKKIEWLLRKNKPDFFVFESKAMQLTATHGRGVPQSCTSIVHLGVDTNKFYPAYEDFYYAHEALGVDRARKIIFYSGHMEERKGVRIIIQAAISLFEGGEDSGVHFVLCGNKPGEESRVFKNLKKKKS
ncbi:MAG: hypothetical protein RL497_1504 [Pseudomonadota bacterium]